MTMSQLLYTGNATKPKERTAVEELGIHNHTPFTKPNSQIKYNCKHHPFQ